MIDVYANSDRYEYSADLELGDQYTKDRLSVKGKCQSVRVMLMRSHTLRIQCWSTNVGLDKHHLGTSISNQETENTLICIIY
ncbi:hypothetical protein EWB00_010095 [Schistosoma japonicum]|uniref:Uncharacterized protein n=1 Tax=Schistosoma japonicum TaxID=6182 RepID=A0A4Z2DQE2_SCHJA|nr:hypothetical protein EWB00_010095 [Schistosoma japonicum]